jgi:hypothetical protein
MSKSALNEFTPIARSAEAATMPSQLFSDLGLGEVAYLKQMTTDELRAFMPESDDLPSGFVLWALLSAEGRPICLSESKNDVLENAHQQELTPVSLH